MSILYNAIRLLKKYKAAETILDTAKTDAALGDIENATGMTEQAYKEAKDERTAKYEFTGHQYVARHLNYAIRSDQGFLFWNPNHTFAMKTPDLLGPAAKWSVRHNIYETKATIDMSAVTESKITMKTIQTVGSSKLTLDEGFDVTVGNSSISISKAGDHHAQVRDK